VTEWRNAWERTVKERLRRARLAGDLPKGVNPADFAKYLCTVWTGLAVQAASGATRSELARVVEIVLRSLPF
jgi:hypothetical protein